MYLMYYLDENGKKMYTLEVINSIKHYKLLFNLLTFQKTDPNGKPTFSAHPARFSPEDKYSKQRLTIKRRFKILKTQTSDPVY